MAKSKTIPAQRITHEETRLGGIDTPEVAAAFQAAIAAQDKLTVAADVARRCLKSLLLQGAKAGWTLDDHRRECKAHETWPKKDGEPVGEKAARKTAAGDLFNSLQAVYGRYQSKDGVLTVTTNEDGDECLTVIGKTSLEAVKAFQVADTPPEAATVAAQQAILDNLNPELFDRLRPHFDTLGWNFAHLIEPGKRAA